MVRWNIFCEETWFCLHSAGISNFMKHLQMFTGALLSSTVHYRQYMELHEIERLHTAVLVPFIW